MHIFYRQIIVAVFFILLIPAGQAAAKTYGTIHHVDYLQSIDADTIIVNIRGIHPLIGDQIQVRLLGISAPSVNGRCEQEKEKARAARAIVDLLLKRAGSISLRDAGRGRAFYISAAVIADGVDIREVLVKKNLASWSSETRVRKDWCKPSGAALR